MVSGVLHNACLRMEEEGVDLDDIVSPPGLHRWLGRSGIALGGAGALLVGAVFGGILEAVPVLLPPPAVAASAPLPAGTGVPLSAVNPWSIAASVLTSAPSTPALPAGVPDPGTLVPAPGGGSGGGGGTVSCGTCGVVSTPVPTLPVGGTGGGGGGGTTTTTIPGGGGSGSGGGGGGLLQTVQQVVASPTSVVTNPTGTVTGVVQGVTGATSTLSSPTTSTSTSPTSTITSTVTSTTNTVTSTVGSLGL